MGFVWFKASLKPDVWNLKIRFDHTRIRPEKPPYGLNQIPYTLGQSMYQ